MKRNLFYIFFGLITTLVISACADKPKNGRTDTYSSGAIYFASDESFSPIIDDEKQIFEVVYPKAEVTPIYTDEVNAINLLLKDSVNLAITTRKLTKKEMDYFHSKQLEPKQIPLAQDGLALIVNKSNTDTCITVDNIRKILLGKVKKWNEINPKSNKGDILVVFDNKNSSTVQFASDSILGGKPISSPNVMATKNTADVIDFVEKNPNAIGIIGSNWLNDAGDSTNLTFKKNIRVMSVSKLKVATVGNSWKPYQAYLYNGNYPLVRTIWALVNDPYNGLPWGFAQFIASSKGQLILLKSGLLPVQANVSIRDVNVNAE